MDQKPDPGQNIWIRNRTLIKIIGSETGSWEKNRIRNRISVKIIISETGYWSKLSDQKPDPGKKKSYQKPDPGQNNRGSETESVISNNVQNRIYKRQP